MRKLVYYVGVSVDGFIAGPGGEFDFYPLAPDMLDHLRAEFPETAPTHIRPQLGLEGAPNRRFGTVIMGRATYQVDADVTNPYAHLRQYVVSRSLGESPDPAVELVPDDPVGLVRRLKDEPGDGDIWLCGGGVLAGQLLPEIDELVVKRYPVVAGGGLPMFAGPFRPRAFAPVETHTFSNGGTITAYRPAE
ncbi:dihydrofolate reductase family protein [Marinitenerispora sediminis]|uniref:Deaminase n=1 Tax=Marinitenerispora sediminis TaxID=1931232 RepID=A0A368SZZ5_9ACTN|nr:dihydrofolate reductase family protein [Marinitenerispora sediminis]RCV47847.1 deaminase [Marinitenerispora sediminis]RCV48251.1 deaminase [Marinitenerispora sediminis]RCV51971.1 deaminase [Marinitenerispora sediminis]